MMRALSKRKHASVMGAAPAHGGARTSEQGNNITLKSPARGTNATYTLKRLKRDA